MNSSMDLEKGFNIIKKSGTVVEISNLRSEWDREKLLNLKRYLQRLLNPVQENSKNFQIELVAEDFKLKDGEEPYDYNRVNGVITNVVFEKLSIKTTTISCEIDNDGKVITTSLDDKGINIFELEEDNNYPLLRNIKIKLSYLNSTAKSTFTKLMGVPAVQYGHVFLFKNGFRILPCGEMDDDWLGLNLRKTQGIRRYLGTREILGRIEINGNQPEFRETTNRFGGLTDTPSYKELKKFFFEKILRILERYVVEAISWDNPESKNKDFDSIKKDSLKIIKKIAGSLENKKLKYNEDFLKIVEDKTIKNIPETIKNLEGIVKKEKDKEIKLQYIQQINSLKQGLILQKAKQKSLVEEKQKKERENLFLTSIISKDLQNVLNLHHHIKISSINIKRKISDLIKKNNSEEVTKDYLEKTIKSIDLENNKIFTIATFATKANFELEGSDMQKNLIDFISDYIKNVCPEVYRGENNLIVEFNVIIKTKKDFITWFKPIEITMILDNLIDNSIKAKSSEITLELDQNEKNELLIFYKDNGKGISLQNKDKIFDFGFTTTNGSGMGLFNIKKVILDMNGKIKLLENEKKGVIFEIVIPRIK